MKIYRLILCSLLITTISACAADRLGRRIAKADVPDDVRVMRDVAYGADERQRFDVYLPQAAPQRAPVLFMVHGGGWRRGDKGMAGVVDNKVAHWLPRGFVVISANYRMVPEADPLEQARDIARAVAFAQKQAASWGGDPGRFVLMGHSAGAHLVALLNAAPATAYELGAKPWLGTVALDSGAFDVVRIMQAKHPGLYDKAFGTNAVLWQAASPSRVVSAAAPPLLAVCSTRREVACEQARLFADKSAAVGARVTVLEQDLSHGAINSQLGEPGPYTAAVDAFLQSLETAARPAH